ncbi:hypothetical protein BUALT_Bualt02G0099600 [Buddleja alternifolia]|uniref:Uncharacterized protein n=1 Tax=Buddleja alternifolia TaxID=168488 RepID=A0AAV6Y5R2_9LAMI|nr:hypothetical protein BUALT_Bualt02G0099600 [Buddleja alternifolia]
MSPGHKHQRRTFQKSHSLKAQILTKAASFGALVMIYNSGEHGHGRRQIRRRSLGAVQASIPEHWYYCHNVHLVHFLECNLLLAQDLVASIIDSRYLRNLPNYEEVALLDILKLKNKQVALDENED